MTSSRTTHLNALYERLKNANGISISDLAREFEVSTKTIQRDCNRLKNLQSPEFKAFRTKTMLC